MTEKFLKLVFDGNETYDGAGVRLRRMFGGNSTALLTDPFLLLDQFGSSVKEEYEKGFPWHPHRGIETVTYLLQGKVVHEDSNGNRGTIYPSDVQWMSAASGIYHQEMPSGMDPGNVEEAPRIRGSPITVSGFQLWINMPSRSKMDTPTYRDLRGSKVPIYKCNDGSTVKVIMGKYGDAENRTRISGLVDPSYFDVSMVPDSTISIRTGEGYTTILHGISGSGNLEGTESSLYPGSSFLMSNEGEGLSVQSSHDGFRFIIMSGRPLKEPVWWSGPIVMDSREKLNQAFLDLKNGNFIRNRNPVFEELS